MHTYIAMYLYFYTRALPSVPTSNIHIPGMPTLLVWVMAVILGVCDPGMVTELTPSPALIPARALLSHCISPSA